LPDVSNASKAALLVSKRVLTTPGRQTGRAIADIGINGLGQSAPDDKSRAARWRAIKKPAAGFPARALNSSDDEGGYAGDLPDVSNSTEVLAPVFDPSDTQHLEISRELAEKARR
jgi:hypothetical protein